MLRTLFVVFINIWATRCNGDLWFQWKQLDFEFPTPIDRQSYINSGAFQPINTLPLDVDYFSMGTNQRVFVTVPRFKPGVPATLATVVQGVNGYPVLRPYPSWDVNTRTDCSGLFSVLRIKVSQCGHVWVVDSGRRNILSTYEQACPPKLRVYDLQTDRMLWEYMIPPEVLTQDSLLGTIELQGDCLRPFAYLADIVGQGIVVVNTASGRSWRVANRYTQADPSATTFNMNGETFQFEDGTISIAAAGNGVYFHSLAGRTENYVPVSVLNNERNFLRPGDSVDQFQQSSGQRSGQSGPAVLAQGGSVMLFSNLPENSLYCWRTGTSYEPKNLYRVFRNDVTFQFASGMKAVKDNKNQEYVLAVTNRFQAFANDHVNPNEVNYRILYASVDDLVAGYPCSRYYK